MSSEGGSFRKHHEFRYSHSQMNHLKRVISGDISHITTEYPMREHTLFLPTSKDVLESIKHRNISQQNYLEKYELWNSDVGYLRSLLIAGEFTRHNSSTELLDSIKKYPIPIWIKQKKGHVHHAWGMIIDYALSTFNLTHPQFRSSKEITSAEFNSHLDMVVAEIFSKWHPAKLIGTVIKDDTPQLGRSALLDIFLTHKDQFISSYIHTDWPRSHLPEGLPINEA